MQRWINFTLSICIYAEHIISKRSDRIKVQLYMCRLKEVRHSHQLEALVVGEPSADDLNCQRGCSIVREGLEGVTEGLETGEDFIIV